MKCKRAYYFRYVEKSHPARGAWIEMALTTNMLAEIRSHPARGAWIEITNDIVGYAPVVRRTPQGVRGLKCNIFPFNVKLFHVAPRKGCVD